MEKVTSKNNEQSKLRQFFSGDQFKAMLPFIGLVVIAAVAYAVISTGSVKGAWKKLGRNVSEVTGGIIGDKPDNGDKE